MSLERIINNIGMKWWMDERADGVRRFEACSLFMEQFMRDK